MKRHIINTIMIVVVIMAAITVMSPESPVPENLRVISELIVWASIALSADGWSRLINEKLLKEEEE